MARHAQVTQNNKFAISLQYLQKEVSDEVHFLHADKHNNSSLQIYAMILLEMVKHSQSSQNRKFAMSLQYLKKGVGDEVDVDKHQTFIQVDFNTLGIKVYCKVILHHSWVWSNILKVFKVTSLQYLCIHIFIKYL